MGDGGDVAAELNPGRQEVRFDRHAYSSLS